MFARIERSDGGLAVGGGWGADADRVDLVEGEQVAIVCTYLRHAPFRRRVFCAGGVDVADGDQPDFRGHVEIGPGVGAGDAAGADNADADIHISIPPQ